jgi:hypothetical protein
MGGLINLCYAQPTEQERLLARLSIIKTVYAVAEWRALLRSVGYEGDYWTLRRPLAA